MQTSEFQHLIVMEVYTMSLKSYKRLCKSNCALPVFEVIDSLWLRGHLYKFVEVIKLHS